MLEDKTSRPGAVKWAAVAMLLVSGALWASEYGN